MSLVRKATLQDIDWIVDVGIKDMATLYDDLSVYDSHYLKTKFIPYLIDNGIVLVIENYAAIIGMLTPHPYNPSILVAYECMWWVREDKRQGSAGIKLLYSFEEEAKIKGASKVSLSLMPSSTVVSLSKRGYVEKESSYNKEL